MQKKRVARARTIDFVSWILIGKFFTRYLFGVIGTVSLCAYSKSYPERRHEVGRFGNDVFELGKGQLPVIVEIRLVDHRLDNHSLLIRRQSTATNVRVCNRMGQRNKRLVGQSKLLRPVELWNDKANQM